MSLLDASKLQIMILSVACSRWGEIPVRKMPLSSQKEGKSRGKKGGTLMCGTADPTHKNCGKGTKTIIPKPAETPVKKGK